MLPGSCVVICDASSWQSDQLAVPDVPPAPALPDADGDADIHRVLGPHAASRLAITIKKAVPVRRRMRAVISGLSRPDL
jgi:hypothetical protein